MPKLSIHDLLKVIQEKKSDASIQKETGQVYSILKIQDVEFPLFARILPGEVLIQLLIFFPCNLKADTMNDTARLLHLLNKDLDLPGFGMDEMANVVFYRMMVPVKDKKLDHVLIHSFIDTCELVCKTFMNAVVAVATGNISYEEILKKAKEEMKKQQAQQDTTHIKP